jgi:hypothetical protein
MRRCLTLFAFAISLLTAYIPPVQALPSIGDLLYPKDSVNDNIDRLEAALQALLQQFGNTVDTQTLNAMKRMVSTLQSARLAYGDALSMTLKDVGDQRAALLYDVQNQMLELQNALTGVANTLSVTEQRTSNTLLSVARAKRIPLLGKR